MGLLDAVRMQGGGWCNGDENCYLHTLGELGSSKTYPPTLDYDKVSGYFSSNSSLNPMVSAFF